MEFTHYDLDNLDHDPELAVAIGNMIIAWSRAETSLVNVFSLVTGTDFNLATIAYYRIPSFEARCKVVLAVLEAWQLRPPARRDALVKHVQKLRSLAKTRNDWVHGLWCLDGASQKTVVFDFRQSEETTDRRRIVKAHDVLDHVRAVRKRTGQISELVPLKINKHQASSKK